MILQSIQLQRFVSHLVGFLANCRVTWIKNGFIRWFIRRYRVDMSSAAEKNPFQYPTFNAFFTRSLAAGKRPIAVGENLIIAPVDGSISGFGLIDAGTLIQAKGHFFHVQDLLGGSPRAACFTEGTFMTFYLSPKDYHRVHMPLSGRLQETCYVPGSLFPVHKKAVETVPGLFARNERVIAFFDTVWGEMAVILVGAMIVGSIATSWGGVVAPRKGHPIDRGEVKESIQLKKGDEMGRFQLGSTVILLFNSPRIQWVSDLCMERSIRLGQAVGEIR